MPTCKLCSSIFPNSIKINNKRKNLQNRKFCLTCSPPGNHNTKQLHIPAQTNRVCPYCKETKPLNLFYSRRNKIGTSTYCIPCTNTQAIKRQREFKIKCVEYKGGKCKRCNYSKYIGALEFHHLNPKEKDFSPSNSKSLAFSDKVKKELDKCELLCANCHRETHAQINNINF